ncbi:MAG: hypothetical protein ACTHOE_03210 [Conexibacter sp.]
MTLPAFVTTNVTGPAATRETAGLILNSLSVTATFAGPCAAAVVVVLAAGVVFAGGVALAAVVVFVVLPHAASPIAALAIATNPWVRGLLGPR